MPRVEDYNKGLIYTEVEGCIDCNKCIHECPILKSNVSAIGSEGNHKMCVDERECILCGTCIDTCIHDVRHYRDDCASFFSDLEAGKEFSIVMAPSFCLNYPDEYRHVLGYLKSLGVKNFYSVSFGADIAIWGYLNHIAKNKTNAYITQPCPSIVSYIEKNQPELLSSLIPIQSPMMCTAIYLKQYIGITEDIAFISPCIAKKTEIQSPRGLGLIRHNVTFNNLMAHIRSRQVHLYDYPAITDEIDYGMGSLFPKPGGLRENVEFYSGHEIFTAQVEGENRVYDYLKSYAGGVERQIESLPMLVDVLNCKRGCLYGTGTEFRHTNNNKASYRTFLMRGNKINVMKDAAGNPLLDPALRFAKLNEMFKDLRPEDFMCSYSTDTIVHTRATVTEDEIEAIFTEKLMKLTGNDQHIDCAACGYKTCYQMAEAIALDINHHDNCVYYVKNALAKSIEDLRASESVRQIQERLKTMLDASPMMCVMFNEQHEALEVNQAAVDMLGLSEKQVYFERFYDICPEIQPDGTPTREKWRQLINEAFEKGRTRSEWMHQTLDDKQPIPCETYLECVSFENKRVVIAYVQDLREQWDMLAKLEDALGREQEANRAKTKFLSTMSHEIRTPMNSVLGIAEIQLQKGMHPPETEEAFHRIYNSSNLLLSIINDILDLSKVEAGKMEITPVAFDTAGMVVDTVQLNIMYIGSKRIELKLHVDENLPAILIGDELRIKQILNNLLSNAFKYTEEGTVSLTFGTEAAVDDDIILIIDVNDTGQGMTRAQVNSLFNDEYTRFQAYGSRYVEGSGLGLVITHRLIDMMNGEITVNSEPGVGSTFTVRLPLRKKGDNSLGAQAAANIQNVENMQTSLKKITVLKRYPMPYGRVLVVDDVESNLYVAKGFLMPYKLKVDTATSAAAAISIIKAGDVYDVIFMDHMMPGMDGIEATKIIRGMGYTNPIVALTANVFGDAAELFSQNQFSGFIPKPIDIWQLNEVLNKFIRDVHPQEAVKYNRKLHAMPAPPNINPQLLQIFCKDIKNNIEIFKESFNTGNLKLFTTAAHGMKSALAYIGEYEASQQAKELETAGFEGDTEGFIETLEKLIKKFSPGPPDTTDDIN